MQNLDKISAAILNADAAGVDEAAARIGIRDPLSRAFLGQVLRSAINCAYQSAWGDTPRDEFVQYASQAHLNGVNGMVDDYLQGDALATVVEDFARSFDPVLIPYTGVARVKIGVYLLGERVIDGIADRVYGDDSSDDESQPRLRFNARNAV